MREQSELGTRLKYKAHIEMGQSPPSTEYNLDENGLPFLQGTADFGKEFPAPKVFCNSPNKVAISGDILFSVRAPVGELNTANQDYGIGRGLCAVRAGSHLNARFTWWALYEARGQLNYVTTGSTYDAVSVEDVANIRLPDKSIDEQYTIADFLDQETTKIDELIAAKERLLGFLAEKRKALTTHAVTSGLNSDTPFRESGIPWLDQIPQHWETLRLAWLFHDRDERCEPALPLLEVSINTGVMLREFSEDRIESTASDFNTYKVARKGDIVFNKMRMWQGAVGMAPEDGLVSPDYTVAVPVGELAPEYAELLFRTEMFSAECARNSHGIVWDRLRLYWEGFRDIVVPVPPAKEQQAIVGYIKKGTAKLDVLREATVRTIGLSKERRAALIAAAVTGQIEV